MEFDLNRLTAQMADHLAPHLEGVRFYEDPAQQGVKPPCLFLQGEEGKPDCCPGGGQSRVLTIKLTYRERPNDVRWMEHARQVAELLDQHLDVVEYRDKEGVSTLLRSFDRHWEVAGQELIYRLSFRLRLRQREEGPLMGRMAWQATWKFQKGE